MESIYSVSQANSYIKNMFAQDFLLRNISVRGEVSNVKYHSTNHIYFSIKDRTGVLSCVMFAGKRRGLDFVLQEGLKIIVKGSIQVYERDGKYQLYADKIEKEGTGDLYKKFLALKEELEEMGMFDPIYKKDIPKYATRIGIVTASTGAAIQDIINVSKRRNPYVSLILYPATVQGENAAQTIAAGIECLDERNLDIIIVGRGGGSIEDLWAFNEEIVARAIFNAKTPIISAVGHEVDFTIADFVADLRAPTPSAAAELAVFEFDKLQNTIFDNKRRMNAIVSNKLNFYKKNIQDIQWKLNKMSPEALINTKRMEISEYQIKMQELLKQKLNDRKVLLMVLSEKLNGLSPLNKLSKGFAYISDSNNRRINRVSNVNVDDDIKLYLSDGIISATVKEIDNKNVITSNLEE